MRAFPFLFLMFVALSWPQTLEQLSKQGNDLIAAKDLPAAEQFFGAAADKARAASDRRWEAEFERAIGETFERRFDYVRARPQYQKALAIRLAFAAAEAPIDNAKEIARHG